MPTMKGTSTFIAAATFMLSCTHPPVTKVVDRTPGPGDAQFLDAESAASKAGAPVHVQPGSLGPHLAETEAGWVLAWASPIPDGYRLFTSQVMGQTVSDATAILDFEGPLTQLLIEPSQTGSNLMVLAIQSAPSGDHLDAVLLGSGGELQAPKRRIQSTPAQIIWAQVQSALGDDGRRLVFWAEKQGHVADLYVAPLLDANLGGPRQIQRDAVAWQVAQIGGKAALSILSRKSALDPTLELSVHLFDASGQPHADPIPVAELNEGGMDLDMVEFGEQLLLAWSEPVASWSRLQLATVDLQKRESVVRHATPPRGDQTLLRLVSAQKQAYVAWEEPRLSRPTKRQVWIGKLDKPTSESSQKAPAASGAASPTIGAASAGDESAVSDEPSVSGATSQNAPRMRTLGHWDLLSSDNLLPLFSNVDGELSMLAQGEFCQDEKAHCKTPTAERFFARFDGESVPTVTRLTPLADSGRVQLAWDLTCSAEDSGDRPPCAALLSDADSVVHVYVAELGLKKQETSVGAFEPLGSGVAHLTSQHRIRAVPELSDLQVMGTDSETVVAWLSYFDPNEPYLTPKVPAPDGRRAPVRAQLTTEYLQNRELFSSTRTEAAVTSSESISLRARSFGGLGLARNGKQALLGWAALDNGSPQLFSTLLDETGRRVRQKMLTHRPGEVYDVTVTSVQDDFIVSFIAGPLDQQEVYAMRVDRTLRASRILQVSHGAGTPSGLSAQWVDDELLVVWSDARDDPNGGRTQIYAATIDAAASAILSPEAQVTDAEGACVSPQLGASSGPAGRLVLSYIELDVNGPATAGSAEALDFGRLSYVSVARGPQPILRTLAEAAPLLVPVEQVGAFSLDCSTNCRAALTSRLEGAQTMWLAELGAQSARASSVMTLHNGSPFSTVPVLFEDQLYYSDLDRPGGTYQLMMATIEWHVP